MALLAQQSCDTAWMLDMKFASLCALAVIEEISKVYQ